MGRNEPMSYFLICFSLLFPIRACLGAEALMDGSVLDVAKASAANFVKEGLFFNALRSEERALKMTQEDLGPIHPSLVPILNDIGTIHRYMGHYVEAEKSYKWGLAIIENHFGPGTPETVPNLDLLAALYVDLGHYEEAMLFYQKALRIQEKSHGSDPRPLVDTLRGIGDLDLRLGKGSEAQEALDRCFSLQKKSKEIDELDRVETLEGLAEAAELQGRLEKAENDLKAALALREKDLPAGQGEIADSQEKLADFYQAHQRTAEAKTLYEKNWESRKRLVGPDLYVNIPYLYGAARTNRALGNWKDAELLYDRVLNLKKQFFGDENPQVAYCLMEMADLSEAQKDKTKSLLRLKEAKKILEKNFDPDHPGIVKIQDRLGK